MSSTGTIYASGCSDSAAIGSRSWSNPTNADGAQNGTEAHCDLTVGFGNISHYLIAPFAHGLGPSDNFVGVAAAFYRRATLNDSSPPADYSIRLVKNGTVGGSNKAAHDWPQSGAWSSDYGGASDLWGLTFNGGDTIGLAIACEAADPNDEAWIDAARMTIYYSTVTSSGLVLLRRRRLIWEG